MGFRLATALWGNWYVERFLGVTIPSLLAAGNIPSVLRDLDGRFDITTRAVEARRIRSSRAYAQLASVLPVDLRILPDAEFLDNPHETHKRVWQASLEAAAQRDEWVAFVPADGCWAQGSLGAIAKQFADGRFAVCGFHLRVDDAAFLSELDRLPKVDAPVLSIRPRELVDLALRNCAPLNCAHFRDAGRMPTHAELVLFAVPGEGILLRSIATHLWAIAPARFRYTPHFGPATAEDVAQIGYLTDSDEFAYVALMPLSQQINWYLQKQDCSARDEGILGTMFFSELSNDLWRHSFVFHRGDMTASRWLPVRRQADAHMVRVYLETKALWIHKQLKQAGLTSAAKLVAAGLHLLRWRQGWPRRQAMSVLAPAETAFRNGFNPTELLKPGRESELDGFLRRHVVVGSNDLYAAASGAVRTAADSVIGLRVEQGTATVDDHRLVRQVARSDDPLAPITVYEIDGILR